MLLKKTKNAASGLINAKATARAYIYALAVFFPYSAG